MNVRIRGIYATALTKLFLADGHEVVDASPPIRERFREADGTGVRGPDAVDASIRTTDDREGVGVHGECPAVDAVADRLSAVGIDAFVWPDATPTGGIFDGEVTETLGGGAVVRLADDVASIEERLRESRASGDPTDEADGLEIRGLPGDGRSIEGYLPYAATDDRIEVGDAVRVQVRESAPPWGETRPELDTEIRVPGALASLVPGEGVRVESHDEAAGRELAGMVDLLGLEPPDGWGVVWHRPAVDAGMDALESGLSRVIQRVETVSDVRGEPVEPPRPLAFPTAGAWCWFGRASRFELDERRRAVATTMPGHHRLKAGSEAASAGVDLAEALCGDGLSTGAATDESGDGPEFPFGVATAEFGPREGDRVRIAHGKPAGHLIVLGEGEVTEIDPAAGRVTVERAMTAGGTYDALGVPRESGDVATTTFTEGRWWYPTTYRDADGTVKGTYLNVCTPVEVFPEAVRYVDLHVDVIKRADGTIERVDDDELTAAVDAGYVSEPLAERARSVASAIEKAV